MAAKNITFTIKLRTCCSRSCPSVTCAEVGKPGSGARLSKAPADVLGLLSTATCMWSSLPDEERGMPVPVRAAARRAAAGTPDDARRACRSAMCRRAVNCCSCVWASLHCWDSWAHRFWHSASATCATLIALRHMPSRKDRSCMPSEGDQNTHDLFHLLCCLHENSGLLNRD